jgi:predicted phosphate transport protein (TIGR00153 family)
MRFSLIPREEKFFDMFDEVAVVISRAAGKFLDMVTEFDRLTARSNELKHEERAGDDMVERIIQALDRSFITPIDREDIHALATSLDDILDNMEETAHRFGVFRIDRPTPEAVAMAKIIQDCCLHLEHAIRLVRTMKDPEAVQSHLKEITRLENEADTIYRDSDSALFVNPPDILQLIKWRELYSWLEETVDACKNTALVISEIVIKGS